MRFCRVCSKEHYQAMVVSTMFLFIKKRSFIYLNLFIVIKQIRVLPNGSFSIILSELNKTSYWVLAHLSLAHLKNNPIVN